MNRRPRIKPLNRMNELMIVNPGMPEDKEFVGDSRYFLGLDGVLYMTPSIGRVDGSAALEGLSADDRYFLGDDGVLYRTL